ncbi:hypothetical protein MNBD_GAMMA07-694 [hydrothermal vent metagenome]|uniref:Uncharacterized protein n=1 Tax=hydrothermal vent metagenome TaxID=652676 RepID=A0A3B0X1I2_9ZZZZ
MQFFLLISGLLFILSVAGVNAKQAHHQALQVLKQQSLSLERDILLFHEKAQKPLNLYLTQHANHYFDLNIMTVLLDGKLLVRHIYKTQEKMALKKGGAQLLFKGAIAEGKHKLTVFYRSGKAYQAGNEYQINKINSVSTIEITLIKGQLKEPFQQPTVAIKSLDKSTREIDSVIYRHFTYLKETNPGIDLISHIMKVQTLQSLGEFELATQLIKAKLYLAKGLSLKASEVLKKIIGVLDDSGSASGSALDSLKKKTLKNEARFYLGKSYYDLDEPEKTIDVLSQINFPIRKDIQAEMQHLYSLTLMSLGEYKAAVEYLREHKKNRIGNWDLYSQLNLSIALIQTGKANEGLNLIANIGEAQLINEESKTLYDEVNQSLGYLLLNQNKPDQARKYLEKVSLNGPYSNLALLGAGWASSRLAEYNQAVIPWLALQKKDMRDMSVQESMLTVPYAFEKMDLFKKANNYYQKAVNAFEKELMGLIDSISMITQGQLTNDLKYFDVTSENDWLISVENASDSKSLRYIKQLISDKQFFNLIQDFREAKYLKNDFNQKIKKIIEIKADLLEIADRYNQKAAKKNRKQNYLNQQTAEKLMTESGRLKLRAQKNIDKIMANLQSRALYLLAIRKAKLGNYLVQSRVALAQNYDRLNP